MSPSDQDLPSVGEKEAELTVDLLEEAGRRAGLEPGEIDRLAEWLAEQLEHDRFARLERAGHAVEDRINLARVFVDLEVTELPSAKAVEGQNPTRSFIRMLNQADEQDKLWFKEFAEKSGPPEDVEAYALIGGPGQGKSTLGQYLCQIHRAWLLCARLEKFTKPAQQEAIIAFSGPQAMMELGRPAVVCFPLRIALSEAAAWLASQGELRIHDTIPELLRYFVEHERCPISAEALLSLLKGSDCLLVLDGLDEVPASSNRERLLASARSLIECMKSGARRLMLLATTRPQGYSGEFASLGLECTSLHLVPLSPERAQEYARRLIQARFPAERQETVLQRLEQAAQSDATARLMRTPLQITILATLVDRIGRAPSEQWTLFKEYYRVVYEREMERPFEAAELIRLYRPHIDKVHAHVGLLLQVDAEQSGGTDPALSPERFAQVVHAVLEEDGIEGERRRELVEKLGRAVRDRLVLLVELRPDRLGFEIRSIQEFMAAWALSQKGEALIEARLVQIAKAVNFRRVLLFLSSKAFTELSDLRDALVDRLCPSLNDSPDDPLARAALMGSVLALEMLEEGSGLKQTRYVRKLAGLAVKLFELPLGDIHLRLARACLADADAWQASMPILKQAIQGQLQTPVPQQRLGAWAALLFLRYAGEEWAQPMIDAHWHNDNILPSSRDPDHALSILEGLALFGDMSDQFPIEDNFYVRAEPWLTSYLSQETNLHTSTEFEKSQIASDFLSSLGVPSPMQSRVYKLIVDMQDGHIHQADTLISWWRQLPANDWLYGSVLLFCINAALRQRTSGLSNAAIWDHLYLPLPRPGQTRHTALSSEKLERRPVRIESIHLQNLRGFDSLSIPPPASADDTLSPQLASASTEGSDSGQWIAFLGDNGLGKSTILRSLVFALVDVTSRPGHLPRSTFEAPWRRRGTAAHEPAIVQVSIHGNTYRAEVKPGPVGTADNERLEQSPPFLPYPVFAYGCRRGSALGGASRKVDDTPGAELPTLFDEGADLIHAETWLLLRENAALKDKEQQGPAWRLFQEILKALQDLLPGVDAIEGRGDRIWVRGPSVGEVPLAGLSDGYLTTLGWVVDLMARWIRRAELRQEPIPRDFTRSMVGLVLIDEIDLHLHPKWQLHLISDVRRVFPRMSFIVTTHNPLTLMGLKAEEIWRLKREDGRIVAKQGRDRPELMTGSDIYDTYFGIYSLFPSDLGEMLDRYRLIALNPVRTDEEEAEMHELLAKMQDRGLEPGWEPVPRETIPPYPGDEQP